MDITKAGWIDGWKERWLDHLIQSLYHGTFLSNTHIQTQLIKTDSNLFYLSHRRSLIDRALTGARVDAEEVLRVSAGDTE